ncbi:MAG TPA: peptide deformylase [Lachnospiraceae bacterium]|nr:peptide deformylase [Lachnospiraceae bacterium]
MVREIIHDPLFLGQKSEAASKEDTQIIQDLLDTLRAHLEDCAGMAANMIGEKKCIIAINTSFLQFAMVNPVIVSRKNPFVTEEGCLSLSGIIKTTRYREIEVEYLDQNFTRQCTQYTGWIAQVIQHEIDHCLGILI